MRFGTDTQDVVARVAPDSLTPRLQLVRCLMAQRMGAEASQALDAARPLVTMEEEFGELAGDLAHMGF